jgi:hypothetical protein
VTSDNPSDPDVHGHVAMVNTSDPSDYARINSHGVEINNGYLQGWFNFEHFFEGGVIGAPDMHMPITGFFAQIICD